MKKSLGNRAIMCLCIGTAFLSIPFLAFSDSGSAFLKIPAGARAAAMGNAFTAVSDDADALYWNTAGLAGLMRKEFSATHTELFADMRHGFAAYAQPIRWGTLGVSLGYLSKGTLEGRDKEGKPTGDFTGNDMALSLGYGRSVTERLQAGIGVKYIRGSIAGVSAAGVALDLGGLYRTSVSGLTLGLSIRNIGPGMKFMEETSSLPLTLAGGVSLQLLGGILISGEARYLPVEGRTAFGLGAEYGVFSMIRVRGGYLAQLAGGGRQPSSLDNLGSLTGLGAGLGLKIGQFRMDYAFTPFAELGNVQKISLSSRF